MKSKFASVSTRGPMKKQALTGTVLVSLLSLLIMGAGRARSVRQPAAVTGPTFSNEISRIFQANCQNCHHPGDVAPFSLMTYRDALPWLNAIRHVTATRQMPPWKPSPGCGDFEQTRTLSEEQIDTIGTWIANGAPEGDRTKLPKPLEFDDGWSLGQPDLVLKLQEPYTPPPRGDIYRCFPLPTNLTNEQFVSAIDIRPGDRESVHHVIAYIDTTGQVDSSGKVIKPFQSELLDAKDPGPGYTSFGGPGFDITNFQSATLGGWAPGARPVLLPEGVAMSLPGNARVVLQIHYHPHHGKPLPDKTEIGLYLSKKPPAKVLNMIPIINTSFVIPAGVKEHRVNATWPIPVFTPIHLVSVAPHMHLLGKTMKVEAAKPDGTKECLINIEDWDFNWQGQYQFKTPVALPAGSRLSLSATYDNSESNPRNPNRPPKTVRWGEGTTDEMCLAFIGFTVD
ncbi:MAG TPA: ascorbate-dependent monooxygenase [Thermoanaerobaculia bacterium]|nr:ascorbate-dependent monooxygenase [Thermoanaerobaculia bacterium]